MTDINTKPVSKIDMVIDKINSIGNIEFTRNMLEEMLQLNTIGTALTTLERDGSLTAVDIVSKGKIIYRSNGFITKKVHTKGVDREIVQRLTVQNNVTIHRCLG